MLLSTLVEEIIITEKLISITEAVQDSIPVGATK